MHTLLEITTTDREVISLEDDDGRLSIIYQMNDEDLGPLTAIPIDPLVLELFASAARNRTPIHARGQSVIPLRHPNVVDFPRRMA